MGASSQAFQVVRAEPEVLDRIVRTAISSFYLDLSGSGWCGREREMVSLFAFAHLADCLKGTVFTLAQIGIEVAVPQLPADSRHPGRKGTVCKDLVIWREPKSTMWAMDGEFREPWSVMEWKVVHPFNRRLRSGILAERQADILWLQQKSIAVAGLVGYSLFVDGASSPRQLSCARIYNGKIDREWMTLPDKPIH